MSPHTMAEAIAKAAKGEPIEAVVIGELDRGEREPQTEVRTGVVLTWDEAAPMLAYHWHTGFGGASCRPICAWSKSWIVAVHEYDGATAVGVIPRHPMPCAPGYALMD